MDSKFKTEFSYYDYNALADVIEHLIVYLESTRVSIEEKIMLASLSEINIIIKRHLIVFKKKYKVTLAASQALSLRLMCLKYLPIHDDRMNGSLRYRLMQVCNSIDKQFKLY